jgi:hypothetical protein
MQKFENRQIPQIKHQRFPFTNNTSQPHNTAHLPAPSFHFWFSLPFPSLILHIDHRLENKPCISDNLLFHSLFGNR